MSKCGRHRDEAGEQPNCESNSRFHKASFQGHGREFGKCKKPTQTVSGPLKSRMDGMFKLQHCVYCGIPYSGLYAQIAASLKSVSNNDNNGRG
jgi:hypothetical protein